MIKKEVQHMTTKSFNAFRFQGLNYTNYSKKYWQFTNLVAPNHQRVLLRIHETNLIKFTSDLGKVTWIWKIDQYHIVFLKPWQVFSGYYGTYVLLNQKYFTIKNANRPDPNLSASSNIHDFNDVIKIAQSQEDALSQTNLALVAKD